MMNNYMKLPYRMEIVEDKDEGGYVVSYPDLPGCITCGETIESAVENAQDAKKAWLDSINADLMSADELHSKLQKGYDDIKEGRTMDAVDTFARFRKGH